MKNKQEILGQYFTKIDIVRILIDLVFDYININNIKILEPSFGTGNFITALKEKGLSNIDGCEIDKDLTNKPSDFFEIPLGKKYDLIIGNPPFSKYNLKESYFHPKNYLKSEVSPASYVTTNELIKEKEKIENIFLLKSLKHLKNKNSSVAFVLPISFFIKNKNSSVKKELLKHFSTIIIYQNDKVWFDKNIPCCFAIFTNSINLNKKIVVIYENGKKNEEVFDIKNIHEELIPQVIFHKNNGYIKNDKGIPLSNFLKSEKINIKKSYKENNVSAKNILEKNIIPENKSTENYKIAVVRVGNSSVGKCGLINEKEDILNDMFYIFDLKNEYSKNKEIKESICQQINDNRDYFKNITCRVGSKSIKKEDVLNFKINV
jgi:hypothetical protein